MLQPVVADQELSDLDQEIIEVVDKVLSFSVTHEKKQSELSINLYV